MYATRFEQSALAFNVHVRFHCRNAGTVHGVYNLDDIISQEECGMLSDAADELKENYKSVDDVSKAVKMKL